MAGKLRIDIMEDCPEGFEDRLRDFIDGLESQVCEIFDLLDNIDSVSKLDQIETAFDKLRELGADLY